MHVQSDHFCYYLPHIVMKDSSGGEKLLHVKLTIWLPLITIGRTITNVGLNGTHSIMGRPAR